MMTNFLSNLSPICCPEGAMSQNGICYCTKEQASLHPYACRVICESLNYTLPPTLGCQCPVGYAGELCDQKPCYVYDIHSDSVKFYCLDKLKNDLTEVTSENVRDCNYLGNLLRSYQNFTQDYSACPCFHGALKIFKDDDPNLHSCLCSEPYLGDLCQMEPYDSSGASTTDPVTANTFLAIIAFVLLMVTILICCVRRRQKRLQRQMARDFHTHRYSQADYRRRRSGRKKFLGSYMPLFPIFVIGSNGIASTRSTGDQKSKKNGNENIEEYPLREIPPKDPGEKPKVTFVCDDWSQDMIRKGPS